MRAAVPHLDRLLHFYEAKTVSLDGFSEIAIHHLGITTDKFVKRAAIDELLFVLNLSVTVSA